MVISQHDEGDEKEVNWNIWRISVASLGKQHVSYLENIAGYLHQNAGPQLLYAVLVRKCDIYRLL